MEEIPNNHLGCIKPCKEWDRLPTSTGERRISTINRIIGLMTIPYYMDNNEGLDPTYPEDHPS